MDKTRASIAGHKLCACTVFASEGARAPAAVVAMASGQEAWLIDAVRTPQFAALFVQDAGVAFAAWDAKETGHSLFARWGIWPQRLACATLSAQLLAMGRPLSAQQLQPKALAASVGLAAPPNPKQSKAELAADAQTLFAVITEQSTQLMAHGLGQVSRLEAQAIAAVAAMERHGMPFAKSRWQKVVEEDEHFKMSALAQVARVLGAALPKDATHPEITRALHNAGYAVTGLSRHHVARLPAPIAQPLNEWSIASQRLATAGTAFLRHLSDDGRLRCTISQIGALSGRMACSAPNLQSISRAGNRRSCFRAEDGHRLIVCDYKTCEMRILAEMSGDLALQEAFARDADVHSEVAQKLFKRPVSADIAPELRQAAKGISFGLIYGMGTKALAQTLKTSEAQAEKLTNEFFLAFPKTQQFLIDTANDAVARGFTLTLSGRKACLDAVDSGGANKAQRLRQARNLPIQGTGADIIKSALASLLAQLKLHHPRAMLCHAVHDEIVIEAEHDEAAAIAKMTEDLMARAASLWLRQVPMRASADIAQGWA